MCVGLYTKLIALIGIPWVGSIFWESFPLQLCSLYHWKVNYSYWSGSPVTQKNVKHVKQNYWSFYPHCKPSFINIVAYHKCDLIQ